MRTMDQATLEMAVLMSKRWTVADQQREQRRTAAQIGLDLERLSQIEAESIAAPRELRGSLFTVHRRLRAGEGSGEQECCGHGESQS